MTVLTDGGCRGDDPHLPRDAELLIELPGRIRIHRVLVDRQTLR